MREGMIKANEVGSFTSAHCEEKSVAKGAINAGPIAEKLGVEAQFVEIDWDNKVMELDSNNIDVVWNGMTLTSEVKNAMECTNAYCNNAQVVVVPAK